MASPLRFVVAALAFLGVLGVAERSFAFCRLTTCDENDSSCRRNKGNCVRDGVAVVWNTSTLPYRISAKGSAKLDEDKMQKAVRAAFDAWQNVDCENGRTSLRFEEGPAITEDKPLGLSAKDAKEAGVEPFGIYFRDDEWQQAEGAEAYAATGQSFGTRKGVISYADIELNTLEANFTFDDDQAPSAVDFQAVLTHEVGHYLGLAHSDDPDSIMAPVYCTSDERCKANGTVGKRALADDDIAAVCALYPHDRPLKLPETTEEIQNTPGGTTAGCRAAGGAGPGFPLLVLVPVLGLALRRRGRQGLGLGCRPWPRCPSFPASSSRGACTSASSSTVSSRPS